MAKKQKQKKKKSVAKPMAVDGVDEQETGPQAMDTSEPSLKTTMNLSGMKKNHGKRRAQRLRKEKALEKALASNEKLQERAQKNLFKTERVQSLKGLY